MLRRSVSSITKNTVVARALAEFQKHGFDSACRIGIMMAGQGLTVEAAAA
jgi:hypothetical protein